MAAAVVNNTLNYIVDPSGTYRNQVHANVKSKLQELYRTDINIPNLPDKIYKSPKLIGLVEVIQFVIFIVLVYVYNPFNIKTKYPMLTHLLVLLVGFVYVMLFQFISAKVAQDAAVPFNSKMPQEIDFLIKLLGTMAFFVFSMWFAKWFINFVLTSALVNIIQLLVTVSIIIVLLAIVYLVLAPLLEQTKISSDSGSWLRFIYNVIMYLPCLVLLWVNAAKKDFAMTARPVWILLIIEAILITLYFVVPKTMQKIGTVDGIQLLKEPVYLYNEHSLGSFDELYKAAYAKELVKQVGLLDNDQAFLDQYKTYNYRYSLSAWFYINPQPPSTSQAQASFSTLFNYANKPLVQYNPAKNVLRVRTETAVDSKEYKLVDVATVEELPLQRWNNIVVNYDGATMDVFLNGILVGSKPNVAPFMSFENLTAGQPNGIHGGICNIMYYNKILSKGYIQAMYKVLSERDVPYV